VALEVDAVDVAGEWLRQIPHGADPLRRPQPPDDNRWQRGSVVDALYLADSEETLWSEWYRHLAERGLPPMQQLPRDLWRFRVPSLEVADLSNEERLARVGLSSPVPGRRTWPAYQECGEGLWHEGWPGLLAPSAARPDGLVLCLFIAGPALPATPIALPRMLAEPPIPPSGMRT
jgi:hypothetical protein